MKVNMSGLDRIIRTIIAIAIGVAYFTNIISGILATVLGILAVIFLLTSILGMCPIYEIVGISSCKVKAESN